MEEEKTRTKREHDNLLVEKLQQAYQTLSSIDWEGRTWKVACDLFISRSQNTILNSDYAEAGDECIIEAACAFTKRYRTIIENNEQLWLFGIEIEERNT